MIQVRDDGGLGELSAEMVSSGQTPDIYLED